MESKQFSMEQEKIQPGKHCQSGNSETCSREMLHWEDFWLMVSIDVSLSTFVWLDHPGSVFPGNKWDSCEKKELMSLWKVPPFVSRDCLVHLGNLSLHNTSPFGNSTSNKKLPTSLVLFSSVTICSSTALIANSFGTESVIFWSLEYCKFRGAYKLLCIFVLGKRTLLCT